jgi:hypothetical protein
MKLKVSSLHHDSPFRRWRGSTILSVSVSLACVAFGIPIAAAFVPSTQSIIDSTLSFGGHDQDLRQNRFSQVAFASSLGPNDRSNRRLSTTRLHFMGSDGGILGIGTPELVRFV